MRQKQILGVLALLVLAALALPATADEVDDLILDLTYGTDSAICNSARALGDIGDPRAVDPLIAVLYTVEYNSWGFITERSPISIHVLRCIIEALGKIGDPRAIDPLVNIRGHHAEVTQALGEIGGPEAVDALIGFFILSSRYGDAGIALVSVGEPAVEPLTGLLKHENRQTRINTAQALGEIGSPIAVDSLVDALNDECSIVRLAAAFALIEIEGSSSSSLVGALKNMHNGTETISPSPRDLQYYSAPPFIKKSEWLIEDLAYNVDRAFGVLVEMDNLAVEPLIRAMEESVCPVSYRCDGQYKKNAASALGTIGDPRAVDQLIVALRSSSHDIRQTAAWALGEIGDPRAVDALTYVASKDSRDGIRKEAAEALAKIQAE